MQEFPQHPIKIKEASIIAHVTPRTIKNWIEKGFLNGWQRGVSKRYILDRDEVIKKCTPKPVHTIAS